MRTLLTTSCLVLSVAVGCQSTQKLFSGIVPHSGSGLATTNGADYVSPADRADRAEQRMQHARMLAKQGKADEALFVYSQILAAQPRADAHHAMAVIHDKRGNFVESASHYEMALELDAHNANLLCDRGYSYYLQGDLENADHYLRLALKREPGLARAHNNLGLLMAQRGKIDSALGEFAAAGCSHAEARTNLSYALMMTGEIDAARYQLELARRSDSSLPETQQLHHAMLQIASGTLPSQQLPTRAPMAQQTPAETAVATDAVAATKTDIALTSDSTPQPAQVDNVDSGRCTHVPATVASLSAEELQRQMLGQLEQAASKPKAAAPQPTYAANDLAAMLASDAPAPPAAKAPVTPAAPKVAVVAPPAPATKQQPEQVSVAYRQMSHEVPAAEAPKAKPATLKAENPLRNPTSFYFWR